MKQFFKIFLKRNSIIGLSKDTGYRIYELFFNNAKSECVQPVFSKNLPLVKPAYIKSIINILIERFLPERLCYLPKKNNYYSEKNFKDLGAKDVLSYGWDEFIWKGQPFGFHMQGAQKDGTIKNHIGEAADLEEVLKYFTDK